MLRGTSLHLALGLVAGRRRGRRIECPVELLGATLDEKWDAMDTAWREGVSFL